MINVVLAGHQNLSRRHWSDQSRYENIETVNEQIGLNVHKRSILYYVGLFVFLKFVLFHGIHD